MPSARMGLEAAGFSPATAYDFDRAVALLGRVIEGKLQETVEELVQERKAPPNGKTIAHKPKYTMRDLLYDAVEDDDADDDAPLPLSLLHLPTAGL